MSEQHQQNELQPQKEIFSTQNETIALQTRLILGSEALNPDKKDLPKVEQDQLTDISSETYTLLSSASTQERHQYWQKKGVGEDEAYQQWQQGLVNFVNNPKKTERKQTLSSLKIHGTTINWENFSSQDADLIYQRYFADNTASSVVITTDQGEKLAIASSVDKFVSDVIFSYTEDGKVNFEKLKRDLPTIKAFANIFGENSSEILEAVILAKAKLSDSQKKQELINQANEEQIINNNQTITRINYLNEQEEKLLRWLFETARVEKETSQTETSVITTNSELPTPIYITPEQNLRAAQIFCRNLRERLKKGERVGPPNFPQGFRDSQSGIWISAQNTQEIDTQKFSPTALLDYAQKLQIPMAFYSPNNRHTTLLLKGPKQYADGIFRILVYDPIYGKTQEIVMPNITENFESFKQRRLSQLQYNKDKKEYWEEKDGCRINIPADRIEQFLILEWLKTPPETSITANPKALELIAKGEYNLSIEEDPELPQELKAIKEQQLQFNDYDCVPLSFYNGLLRYAALPGKEEEKQRMVETFANHFGVRILTRRELLGR